MEKSSEFKKITVEQFTRQADDYGSAYTRVSADYPEILEELEKEPVADVLDCGCGDGALLAALKGQHPELKCTGIDITPRMIALAQKRGLEGVCFQVGDCEKLPFEAESFDAVLCSHSFHHYPDPQSFFNSVRRVLRPGGRLILRDNTGSAWFLFKANRILIPIAHLLNNMGDVRFYSCPEAEAFCRAAGLEVERCEERANNKMHVVARRPRGSERG